MENKDSKHQKFVDLLKSLEQENTLNDIFINKLYDEIQKKENDPQYHSVIIKQIISENLKDYLDDEKIQLLSQKCKVILASEKILENESDNQVTSQTNILNLEQKKLIEFLQSLQLEKRIEKDTGVQVKMDNFCIQNWEKIKSGEFLSIEILTRLSLQNQQLLNSIIESINEIVFPSSSSQNNALQEKDENIKDNTPQQQERKENISNQIVKQDQNDDITKSIFGIQKNFYSIIQQENLIKTFQVKIQVDKSDFDIFSENLEAILNCNPQMIVGLNQIGQKLCKQFILTFSSNPIKQLIQDYIQNPQRFQVDEGQIKIEFINFSSLNNLKDMIEEETDHESDPSFIFDEQREQILIDKFQEIQQIQDLSKVYKSQITQEYHKSQLQKMITIYQKAKYFFLQRILNDKKENEEKQLEVPQQQQQVPQQQQQQQVPLQQQQQVPQQQQLPLRIEQQQQKQQQELLNQQEIQQDRGYQQLEEQKQIIENAVPNEQNIVPNEEDPNQVEQKNQELQKQQELQAQKEQILQKLFLKLERGVYVPKNQSSYNEFINELANLLQDKESNRKIKDVVNNYCNDNHIDKVMQLISSEFNQNERVVGRNDDEQTQIITMIKGIPIFGQSLNDKEIGLLIKELSENGFQSLLYQKYVKGNSIIDEKLFSFHLTIPFLNIKTIQMCQFYFNLDNIQLSESECKLIIEQYFYKLQNNKDNIFKERIRLIQDSISSNPIIRQYIEQMYSLSILKRLLQLFNMQQNQESSNFLIKTLISQETSSELLQKLMKENQLNDSHQDFVILQKICSGNQIERIYLKSLLLFDINKEKDDISLQFCQINQFLVDLMCYGIQEVFTNQQHSQLLKILNIESKIITSKDFENLEFYYEELLLMNSINNNRKEELIKLILRKQLSKLKLTEQQLSYLSKLVNNTGLCFIYQLDEQKYKQASKIEKKLQNCNLLKKIYGKDLYSLQDKDLARYIDFESQFKLQNERDELFKIDKNITINQFLEYHQSEEKPTQSDDWIKEIVNLSINQDKNFSLELFTLIIYLSKRNQNLDQIFEKISQKLLIEGHSQEDSRINKKIVIDYLMNSSDAQTQFKLSLLLGFANPIPLMTSRIIYNENRYYIKSRLCYESFWLLNEEDQVIASIGVGFQKGKSQLLNEVFATNFSTSDDSYSFIQSADIQSNHIFQSIKRQYFIADFHGDATSLEEQYLLGFFTYYIIQVSIKLFQNNKLQSLEKVIDILEKNNKKYCIIIRDSEENLNNSDISYYHKQNYASQKIKSSLLLKKNVLLLPNLKIIEKEQKKYHINQIRIVIDQWIMNESPNEKSRNLFIQRFLMPQNNKGAIDQAKILQNDKLREELDNNNKSEKYGIFEMITKVCNDLKQIQNLKGTNFFKVYPVFSKYQKLILENSDRRFEQSSEQEIEKRSINFTQSKTEYLKLSIKKNDRGKGAQLFETIILGKLNLHNSLLFFIQELKSVNNKRVGDLKIKKKQLLDQRKELTSQQTKENKEISTMISVLDEEILENSISIEIFWREIIQLWQKDKNYIHNKQIIDSYATSIYNGFPFEIIDGENFYFPYDFLKECFSHNYFTNKTFCIISIIGPQNSGKSTLLNYFLGCDFNVSDGRCTRGIYGTLVKSKVPQFDYILIIDSEGLLSQEKDDPEYDRKLTLFCLSVSQFLIINVKDQLTPEMTKILEICVEASQYLKANQIPKRIVEIVFNQKADPNNQNNKVAVDKALRSFETNKILSNHIEIGNENASDLPSAFSQKYVDLGGQDLNWRYLKTQITFVEGVQKLGNKIIQKLISLSKQEEQSSFRLVKSIPELLYLMQNIYETICRNPDLTAFKDIEHKKSDQQIKKFIKDNIQQEFNPCFMQKLNEKVTKQSQLPAKDNYIITLIQGEMDAKGQNIMKTFEDYYQTKIPGDHLQQNKEYLIKEITIQKQQFENTICQEQQLEKVQKTIMNAINKILKEAKVMKSKNNSENELKTHFNQLFQQQLTQIQQNSIDKNEICLKSYHFIFYQYKLCLKQNIQQLYEIIKDNNEEFIIKDITDKNPIYLQENSSQDILQFEQSLENLNHSLINSKLILNAYKIFCVRLQLGVLNKIKILDLLDIVQQPHLQLSKQSSSFIQQKNPLYQFSSNNFKQLNSQLKELFQFELNEAHIKKLVNDALRYNKIQDSINLKDIQKSIIMHYDFNDQQQISPNDEVFRIKKLLGKEFEKKYKKWYDYFSFWTTNYDKQKSEFNNKLNQRMDISGYECLITSLKQYLNQKLDPILNFKEFISDINKDIKKSVNNQRRIRVDQELIQKISYKIQDKIDEANSFLKYFQIQLSQNGENKLHQLAIFQLFSQDVQNKLELFNKPINKFKDNQDECLQQFMIESTQHKSQDKDTAYSFFIKLQEFLPKFLNKKSNQKIGSSIIQHKESLSKDLILKEIEANFFNFTAQEAHEYIYNPNKIILNMAEQQSKLKIEAVRKEIENIRIQVINIIQEILNSLQQIQISSLIPDNSIPENSDISVSDYISYKQCEEDSRYQSIGNKIWVAFQQFIFQLLLGEDKLISIDGQEIIVKLNRPCYITLKSETSKEFLSEMIRESPQFQNQLQINSPEQFFIELSEIIKTSKFEESIRLLKPADDIEKEFSSIDDYLVSCTEVCPCCGQICDQDHWKYNEQRGKGQNKHIAKGGHRFASFNGVKIDKVNLPALIMCSDYEDNTLIKQQGKIIKWSKFKDIHSDWDWNFNLTEIPALARQKQQRLWSLIGIDICKKFQINHKEICTPELRNMCKQQVSPIHFIIAFDESGSMEGNKWQELRKQLLSFIALRCENFSGDVCTLIGFSHFTTLYSIYSPIKNDLLRFIPQYNKGGKTDFEIVFSEIIKSLKNEKSQKYETNTIIFFLTDGYASKPENSIKELKSNYSQFIKEIQLIGFGQSRFQILKQMAKDLEDLNGSFKQVLDGEQLSKEFQSLAFIIPN